MKLLEPIALGPRTARNRMLFGPHETNLGDGRSIGKRHVAYYDPRAAGRRRCHRDRGGIGPPRRTGPTSGRPWPSSAATGWAAVADVLHAEGALALAAIGHAGGQGSSAYSQRELWAPSRVPEVASREVPR